MLKTFVMINMNDLHLQCLSHHDEQKLHEIINIQYGI